MVFTGLHDGLFIGQIIIAALVLTLIFITTRNYKIAKLIIRDKTIMFVEVENDEDYDRLNKKRKKFKLVNIDESENDSGNNDDNKPDN